ncbi:MAG: ATP-dependent DNA helicase [Eubacteriales bacterium]|nr:ATP-dependent DNA helicase [Eubacteriales bacterium]
MKTEERISVRNLVEFLLRSGDLDQKSGKRDVDAMQKGTRLHRRIQKSMGSRYESEVILNRVTEFEDLTLKVEGRADGIFEEDGLWWIDEIKGLAAGISKLTEPVPVHKAQAMCYGAIYAREKQLSEIGVQMTYGDLNTKEVRYFREQFTAEQLESWYENLVTEYHKWLAFRHKWVQERNQSAQTLEFPFSYRDGQRKLVGSVYHAIHQRKQIFIQAPTGVGKTMSTVFPAVRSLGEGYGDRIFYLTAKTITRTVAEEAFQLLEEKGLKFKTVTLTAKEKMCIQEKVECDPEKCPYAKGHFDRVSDAVFELLNEKVPYDRSHLEEHAKKWQVCPFEMTLDLSLWVDGIICDYNYVFDPNVYLKRFFGEGSTGNSIFLVDEAHNLVDRSREMYSAVLRREDVLAARKLTKELAPKLYRGLGKVNRELLEMEKTVETYEILSNPGGLPVSLLNVQGEIEKLMEESEYPIPDELLDFYFAVRDFLNISELLDENYVIYLEKEHSGKCRIRLFCINPARNLSARLAKGISTVFFSATLLPMEYYRKLLSIEKDDFGMYMSSPFPKEHRQILLGRDVSSRYERRGYEEYRRIAEYIARVVWQKQGNYMIFFPSYRFMEEVYEIYEREFSVDWVTLICQHSEMNEQEREEFLEEFSVQNRTLAGFCIMGGIFSEGIDLIGEKLIGTIIVGTGLPQVNYEREILMKYYDQKGEQGFDYAYRYPGMNKVLQAAGRVIRTKEDQGVILLLDDRFLQRSYQPLFPREWEDRQICTLGTVEQKIQKFWKAKEP